MCHVFLALPIKKETRQAAISCRCVPYDFTGSWNPNRIPHRISMRVYIGDHINKLNLTTKQIMHNHKFLIIILCTEGTPWSTCCLTVGQNVDQVLVNILVNISLVNSPQLTSQPCQSICQLTYQQ